VIVAPQLIEAARVDIATGRHQLGPPDELAPHLEPDPEPLDRHG
jgi:hypothetical protein